MRRTSPFAVPVAVAFALALLSPSTAHADTRVVAPAGGGLAALDVKVSLADGSVDAGGTKVPIELARAQLPAEGDVTVEAVAVGHGKHVVHVVVPAKDTEGLAWEALLAAGQKPIFTGLTGYVAGDPGERTGREVRVVPGRDTSFVLVGEIREDLRICGQDSTLLETQALYPASLDLRPATAQRLTAEQQAAAQRIVATDAGPRAAPALAKLLVARGSSVPGSRGLELTDGDAATAWTEQRPGMGQGEFVVMAAPKDVPIARMQVVLAPPAPATLPKDGAAPKAFYVATGTETFEVTLPGDAWLKPGEAYEIAFPHPVEASCVSLVLSDAYTRGLAHPEVTVAELVAYSEFDAPGATLEDVAKKLSGAARDRGGAGAGARRRGGARGDAPGVRGARGARARAGHRRGGEPRGLRGGGAAARARAVREGGRGAAQGAREAGALQGIGGRAGGDDAAATRRRGRASRRRSPSSRGRRRSSRSPTRWRARVTRSARRARCCASPSPRR